MQEKQTNHLPRLKEKVKTPEDVPRLFDLIRVKDERMKLAFYAALGNTVVAKDLDQVYYVCSLRLAQQQHSFTSLIRMDSATLS